MPCGRRTGTTLDLRARLLLLALEKGKQGAAGHLHHLEAHTGNVTLRVAGTAETSDEHLVVLVDEVEAAVVGDESGDLLAVLDQLHAGRLADGRVGLLGLDAPVNRERERARGSDAWQGVTCGRAAVAATRRRARPYSVHSTQSGL